jgi:hypothetical protein
MISLVLTAALLQEPPAPDQTIHARVGLWHASEHVRFRADAEPTEGTNVEPSDREITPWISIRMSRDPGRSPADVFELNYWGQTWEEEINSFEIFDGRVVPAGSGADASVTAHCLEIRALLKKGETADVLTMRAGISVPLLWTTTELEDESHSSRAGGLGFVAGLEAAFPDLPLRFGLDVATAFLLGWRDYGWTFDLRLFVAFDVDRFSIEIGDHYFRSALTAYPSKNDAFTDLELHGVYMAVGFRF